MKHVMFFLPSEHVEANEDALHALVAKERISFDPWGNAYKATDNMRWADVRELEALKGGFMLSYDNSAAYSSLIMKLVTEHYHSTTLMGQRQWAETCLGIVPMRKQFRDEAKRPVAVVVHRDGISAQFGTAFIPELSETQQVAEIDFPATGLSFKVMEPDAGAFGDTGTYCSDLDIYVLLPKSKDHVRDAMHAQRELQKVEGRGSWFWLVPHSSQLERPYLSEAERVATEIRAEAGIDSSTDFEYFETHAEPEEVETLLKSCRNDLKAGLTVMHISYQKPIRLYDVVPD